MAMRKGNKPRLASADLGLTLGRAEYESQLLKLQRRLAQIQQAYFLSGRSAVIVFEGWDAAGKGGTIRRISEALDPRSFKVWPIGAPRNYYLQRHYMVRFMECMPPIGSIAAFDRSWYGRVLVERVEELIPEHRWRAAYHEISEFEHSLTDDGVRLVKLFFHISPDEQLARFRARLCDPLKQWKLSLEDFRNRERWDDYAVATDEMFAQTSSEAAPWHLIPANNKLYARIAAIRTIVVRLSHDVDLSLPKLDENVLRAAQGHMEIPPELRSRLSDQTDG
jgi:polyphosphate kinase 2 (PPK2 family)